MAKRKGGIPGMGGNMAGMMKQMQNKDNMKKLMKGLDSKDLKNFKI